MPRARSPLSCAEKGGGSCPCPQRRNYTEELGGLRGQSSRPVLAPIVYNRSLPRPESIGELDKGRELSWSLFLVQIFNFTKIEWGSGTCAPPASWGLVASAPAGGARAQLKGAAGSGWPQWRSAAAVRGQERSLRGCSAAGTGHRTPGCGHPTASLCVPLTAARALPATHARSPRIPGSRWPPRAGRPRACCSEQRCCSWRRCSLWLPQRDPQVRARLTPRSVRLSSAHPRLSLWGPLFRSGSVSSPACVSCH